MAVITPLEQLLKETFGFASFRSGQLEVINHVLDGNDALVVMPTGGGKSLCYQIPALASEGVAIVVSPLIALMEDQVTSLKQHGVACESLNSQKTYEQRQEIVYGLKNGLIKLLYVSPEKLLHDNFLNFIKTTNISFFAIDEAHCVSMWGNDFRSDYVALKKLKEQLPQIPIIALTATADSATQEDIAKQLGVSSAKKFIHSFERDNLLIKVLPARKRIEVIEQYIKNQNGNSGIIYTLSRKNAESVSEKLNKLGISANYYHAGMTPTDRSSIQRRFQNDEIQVICATIAFGMGIDKPNIRFVIHYNLPKNIESYYQEIGRAGRDGKTSSTLLFSNYADLTQLKSFIDQSSASESFKNVQHAKLERMWEFANGHGCRTNFILSYFGEFREEKCGRCDNCLQPPVKADATILVQKALSAVARCRESVNLETLINILRGSGAKAIFEKGYNKIKTYGSGRDLGYLEWKMYITQIINLGYLQIDFTNRNVLKLTELSNPILFDGKKVELVKFVKKSPKQQKAKVPIAEIGQSPLEITIRSWRKTLANEKGIPLYQILTNASIEDIISKRPLNWEDLPHIHGLGKVKIERYGQAILQLVNEHYS